MMKMEKKETKVKPQISGKIRRGRFVTVAMYVKPSSSTGNRK
jgi:hypothetical protein